MEENLKESTKNRKIGNVYKGIKIFAFFCILIFLIVAAGKILQRKESVKKYQDFWELADQVDVLFFGSSHVLNSMNPLYLYEQYGITSYNMAKHGGILSESYWLLMNSLDYCQPKCVVVDLWALDRDYQYVDVMTEDYSWGQIKSYLSFLHDAMDAWPLTKTKIAMVKDILSKEEMKKEFLWNFFLYHNRWSALEKRDFKMAAGEKVEKSYLGASPLYVVNPDIHLYSESNDEGILSDDTVCVQYLYKLIEECEKRNIEVIMTYMPVSAYYVEDCWTVNTGYKIAEEKNILFLDMLEQTTESVLNYKLDMCDSGHANNSGMRKLTSYVGKYLCEVKGIVDHRQDPAYQQWADLVSQLQTEEIQRLQTETNLYLELNMINDLNANAIIFMRGTSSVLQDKTVQQLISRMTGTTAVVDAANVGGPYLLIRDGSSGIMQVQEFVGEHQVDSFSSILGDTCYIGMKNFGAVYVDGNFENNYLNMDEYYETQVQIIILGQDGEVMSKLYYDPVWNDMKRE